MNGKFLLQVAVIVATLAFVVVAIAIRSNRPSNAVQTAGNKKEGAARADRSASKKSPDRAAPNGSISPRQDPTSPSPGPSGSGESPANSATQQAPVKPDEQGRALYEATLLDLIQNAKVAQVKGDETTRDAMLVGLKRNSQLGRALVEKQQAAGTLAGDYSGSYALSKLLEMLQ